MPSKIKSVLGKNAVGSQDIKESPTAIGLNVQVPLMKEHFEKRSTP